MPLQITVYMIPAFALLAFSIMTIFYTWRVRSRAGPIFNTAILIIIISAVWLGTDLLEAVSIDLVSKVFFNKLAYLGVVFLPTAWLIFTLQYTDRWKLMANRSLFLLSIIPITTYLLVWTNEFHGLIWSSVKLDEGNLLLPLNITFGVWFFVYIIYSYIILGISSLLFIQMLFRTHRIYHRQIYALLIGTAVPWATSGLQVGLNLQTYFDLTPLMITVVAVILPWVLIRWQIGGIMPVAYETIVNGMRDGVIVLDERNCIVYVNPSAQKLVKKATMDLIGMHIEKVLFNNSAWRELINVQKEVGREVKIKKRYYNMLISPFINWRGQLNCRVIVLRDTTPIKRAAIEKKKVEDAVRLVEMRDKFISAATHELRTPLVSIKGYLDYILDGKIGPLPDKFKSNLEVVKRNTDQLLSLTNDLLDIRRIESKKVELNIELLNLREIIYQCVAEIQIFTDEKKQNLHLDISDEALSIIGDRNKIRQILLNLLSNATKFTSEKGHITISIQEEKDEIKVLVSDTGIGLRKKDLKRVFDPFAAIEKPTYIKGTGLGLSVTKGLVEAHGGKIWVESRGKGKGKGSTFIFTIPKYDERKISKNLI